MRALYAKTRTGGTRSGRLTDGHKPRKTNLVCITVRTVLLKVLFNFIKIMGYMGNRYTVNPHLPHNHVYALKGKLLDKRTRYRFTLYPYGIEAVRPCVLKPSAILGGGRHG